MQYSGRLPRLLAVVTLLRPTLSGAAYARLSDPSGSTGATLTAEALAAHPELRRGSVLFLRNVAVLRTPEPRSVAHLCLVPSAVDQVLSPAGEGPSQAAAATQLLPPAQPLLALPAPPPRMPAPAPEPSWVADSSSGGNWDQEQLQREQQQQLMPPPPARKQLRQPSASMAPAQPLRAPVTLLDSSPVQLSQPSWLRDSPAPTIFGAAGGGWDVSQDAAPRRQQQQQPWQQQACGGVESSSAAAGGSGGEDRAASPTGTDWLSCLLTEAAPLASQHLATRAASNHHHQQQQRPPLGERPPNAAAAALGGGAPGRALPAAKRARATLVAPAAAGIEELELDLDF